MAFVWGQGGQQLSPEEVQRRRAVAQAQMQAGADYSPVGSIEQGLARLSQGLVGGWQARQAGKAEDAGRAEAKSVIDALLGNTITTMSSMNGPAPTEGSADNFTGSGGIGFAGQAPSAPVGDNADRIRMGLINRGLPATAADGILMNLQDESGLNPGINEAAPVVPGSRGGFGLAQWTGPRRVGLEQAAAQRGVDPSDIDLQLDYLVGELGGSESRAAKSLMAAPDVGRAAASFATDFLRPAPEHLARRVAEYTGGSGYAPQAAAPAGPDISSILAAASNPWVAREYGGVVQALMGQAQQQQQYQQQQNDPLRQLQLAQAQVDLRNSMQPQQAKPIEVGGVLLDPTTYQPIFDSRQSRSGEGFSLSPGQVRYDADGNVVAQAAPEQTARPLSPEDRAQWGIPESDTRPYAIGANGAPQLIGGTGVTVNTGSTGEGAFTEALGKADAATVATVSDAGMAASSNAGRIDRLENILQNTPQGLGGVATSIAGNFGINLGEGTSNIQAAEAIINSLVPQQRPAGSGTMSDADLALFKQSLPRIINSPRGNALIINTIRGINDYDRARADVVNEFRSSQELPAGQRMSRSDMFQRINAIPNPLSNFSERASQITDQAAPVPSPQQPQQPGPPQQPTGITTRQEYDALPPGARYIGPDGKPWTKGGN